MANAVGLYYVLNYASMHRNWKLAYFPMSDMSVVTDCGHRVMHIIYSRCQSWRLYWFLSIDFCIIVSDVEICYECCFVLRLSERL